MKLQPIFTYYTRRLWISIAWPLRMWGLDYYSGQFSLRMTHKCLCVGPFRFYWVTAVAGSKGG